MQERKRIFVDTPFLKAAELPALMLLTGVVVALCYYLASYVMPFLLALLVSFAIEPLVRMLSGTDKAGQKKRVGLPRKLAIVLVMLVAFSLLIVAVFFIVQGLLTELVSLADVLPDKIPVWIDQLHQWMDKLAAQYSFVSSENLLSLVQSLGGYVSKAITTIASSAASLVTNMPVIMLFIVFTIMSTYFLSASRYSIMKNLKRQLPQSWQETARHLYTTVR